MTRLLLLREDEIISRPKRGLRIVHTADWHLGGEIYLHNLYREQERFLHWLTEQLAVAQADVLIVAGDIFDTRVPSNAAQKLYYEFLGRVQSSCRCEVLILGGNHDSPSFLNSPRTLLRHFKIRVQSGYSGRPADLCVAIPEQPEATALLIGAVPYLREAEVRRLQAGESYQDQLSSLRQGLADCYAQVWSELEKLQQTLPQPVPVLLTGHLALTGATLTAEEQGPSIYIGNLLPAGEEIFPKEVSYVALGHLHRAQNLGERKQIRYAGTPLPMSFSEKEQVKSVTLLEVGEDFLWHQELPVEEMYTLREITGDWPQIIAAVEEIKSASRPHFLKISYTGDAAVLTDVAELRDILNHSVHEVVHFSNLSRRQLRREQIVQKSLQELTPEMVFQHCLRQWEISEEKAQQLLGLFNVAQRQLQADAEASETAHQEEGE